MKSKILLYLSRLYIYIRLNELIISEDNNLSKIKKSLHKVLHNDYSKEELNWIEKIELIRKKMLCSSDEITVIDFGAGSAEQNLTNLEMSKGVHKTKLIKEAALVSKSKLWASLLFKLVRAFEPETIIELGTNLGITASYMGAAQELNNFGSIKTLEGADSLAQLAIENFKSLRLTNIKLVNGRFKDSLPAIVEKEKNVEFVFIDGHHDEDATIEYFNYLKPFLKNNSIVIFDDISWSKGMKNAWQKIKSDDKVSYSVDLGILGITIIGTTKKDSYKISMPF